MQVRPVGRPKKKPPPKEGGQPLAAAPGSRTGTPGGRSLLGLAHQVVHRSLDLVVGEVGRPPLGRHGPLAGDGGLVQGVVAGGDAGSPGSLVPLLGSTGRAAFVTGATDGSVNRGAVLGTGTGSRIGGTGQLQFELDWLKKKVAENGG